LYVLTVEAVVKRNQQPPKLNDVSLASGFRLLASLTAASLPLDRVLGVMLSAPPRGWKASTIEEIRSRVREGSPLSEALASAIPDTPSHLIGIVRAAEDRGALAQGLERAGAELDERVALRSALVAALSYPLLLLGSGTVALAILVGVVLPKFAILVADLGQTLPFGARALLAVGEVVRVALLPTLLFAGLVWVALRARWSSSREFQRTTALLLHAVPFVGTTRFSLASSRASGALGSLLGAGMALAPALQSISDAAGHPLVTERLLEARQRVLRGESLSEALQHSSAATLPTVHLVRGGEAIGDLAGMLLFAARVERERVLAEIRLAVKAIEPALILGFGGLVAYVAATLLQTVYALRPTV